MLHSEYSEIKIIGAGADAVDFALINVCKKGDIVVSQDYGVAYGKKGPAGLWDKSFERAGETDCGR